MSSFQYRAKHPQESKVVTGTVEAESTGEANAKLRAQGLLVLSIKEGATANHFQLSFKRQKVTLKEKIIFTRQLSVMIKAGLPIVKALQALAAQTESAYFKTVLQDMIVRVRGGTTLSQAMRRYPKIFPEIYTAVIRAGEETGQLAEVLLNLAIQQEKDADLIGKIRGAMIYPVFILVVLVLMIIIIVYFVLPNLQHVFADSGQKLPLITRVLLGSSTILRQYGIYVLGLLVAAGVALRYWTKTEAGGKFFDRLKISLPVFGNLNRKIYMARFSRTLAMLTKASLPILQSIKIVRQTINNRYYDPAFNNIERLVESGKPLSAAMEKEALFPPMVSQLTSLGEQSGDIESVLLEVADFYDKEVNAISQNLSALIEPLMIVIIGAGVALVVIAVISPIYNISSTIK